MSSILTRLLEKGLPTRDVQIATTGEQQQRPVKFEGAQNGNFYNSDLLVVGGQDNGGFARHFNLDQEGRMIITGQASNSTGGTITPLTTQGHLSEGSNLTATNPFLMAGRYNATPRTLNDGEVGALAVNNEGKIMIDLQNASLTATVDVHIDHATDSVQLYGNDGTANRALKTDATGRQVMVGASATGAAVAGNPVLVGASDGTNARYLLSDTAGRPVMVGASATGAAVAGNPVLAGGSDGTNARYLSTDTTGRQVMVGASAAAAAISGNPVLVGASDGTNARYLLSDTDGRQVMVGAAPAAAAISGNPVLAGGSDGTNARYLSTDTAGRQVMVGASATGAAVAGNPVLAGGSDGTNARYLSTDTAGRQVMIGPSSNGAAVAGNPVLMGGSDGTNARYVKTDDSGRFQIVGGAASDTFFANSGNPVMIGTRGTDNNSHYAASDASGRIIIVGHAAPGNPATGYPILVSGSDGTNTRSLATDITGRQVMVGASTVGAAVAGNPVLMGGSDGTNARYLLADSTGRQVMIGAASEGSAAVGNPVLISGRYDSSARTLSNGTNGAVALESDAKLKVALYGTDGSTDRKVKLDSQGVLLSRNLPDYTFYMNGEASGTGAQLILTPNSGVYTPQTFRSQGSAAFPNYFIIVSTDNGNMYGIGGLEQITIEGYRTSGGLFISETINLNGTTPVSTTNAYNVVLRVISTSGNLIPSSYITVRPDDYNTTLSYLEITETGLYNPIFYNVNAISFCTHISISSDAPSTYSIWTVNNQTESRSVVWRRRFNNTEDYEMDFGQTGAFKVLNNEYIIVMNEGLTNSATTFSLRFDSYKI